jgi:hypothetical protein
MAYHLLRLIKFATCGTCVSVLRNISFRGNAYTDIKQRAHKLLSFIGSNIYWFKIYKTIILPVVLCGRETLSLTLREGHRLREFENRVLRRIFGPKRDEATGGCRGLHNEELHGLYSSPSIVRVIKARRMRWARLDCGLDSLGSG